MPSITKISITVDAITSKFVKKLQHAGTIVTKFVSSLGNLASSLIKLSTIAIASFTAAITAIATKSILAAADLETLQVQFEGLLGSASAAAKRMKELKEFSKTTPFQIKDIAAASRILESLTKGALSAGKNLRMVGDAAAQANQPIEEVALHIGRIFQGAESGRAIGDSLARLQELGMLSGEARNQFEDLQKAGKKGPEVWAVISKELNQANGSMERLSETTKGLWSTLKDNLNLAFAALGKILSPIVKVFLKEFISKFQKLGGLIEKNKNAIQKFITNGLEKLIPVFLQIGNTAKAVFDVIISLFSDHGPSSVDDMLKSIQSFFTKTEFILKNLPQVWVSTWEKIKINAKSFGVDLIAVLLTPFRFVATNAIEIFTKLFKNLQTRAMLFSADIQAKVDRLFTFDKDKLKKINQEIKDIARQQKEAADPFKDMNFTSFTKAFSDMQDAIRGIAGFNPDAHLRKVNTELQKIWLEMDNFVNARIEGNAKKASEIMNKIKNSLSKAGKPLEKGGEKIKEGAKALMAAKDIGFPKLAIKGTQAAADLINRDNQAKKIQIKQLDVLKQIRDKVGMDSADNASADFGFIRV